MKILNDFRWQFCPLCFSKNISMVGLADYSGFTKYSSHYIELERIPEIWNCGQCASSFTQNIIPESISKDLYVTAGAGERWSRVPFMNHKTSQVIEAMTGIFTSEIRILDVGCNTGELLDFAAARGAITAGLEYSQSSRDVLFSKGHQAYSTFDEINDRFDVIVGFDLIEHLYNVPSFLKTCYEKLVPGGKLVLLTGDVQSRCAKWAGSHWWYAQYPEHIVFPSKNYFQERKGFKLTLWQPTFQSKAYKYPFYLALLSFIKRFFSGKKYNGLPSIYPDHALIVLIKT